MQEIHKLSLPIDFTHRAFCRTRSWRNSVCTHTNIRRYLTTSVETLSYSRSVTDELLRTMTWGLANSNTRHTIQGLRYPWLILEQLTMWFLFPNIDIKDASSGMFGFIHVISAKLIVHFPFNLWTSYNDTAKEFTSIV